MQGFDPAVDGVIAVTARAMKERLARFFPASKFVIELMPAAITKAVWLKLTQKTPFIGIAFQDVVVSETAAVNPAVTMRFQVHLVVTATAPETRLLGDRQSPGIVNMLAVAVLGLHAWSIEDVGAVFCGTSQTLAADFLQDNQAVIGIPVHVSTTLIPDEAIAALEDFADIDLVWTFTGPAPAPEPSARPGGDDTIVLEEA
ncbi:hypothetical protein KPL78_29585 [Roseomonas sp. HJA6]|uniref:DUF1834 family protein n=1 Tax=Roseomonas alba TaxID=2846776 RepID=A0ABS7AL04_9PROT|nr:hypothetical protein [Neoroseomonas alba]MBW6402035.1 hypothetical protein [Neoroseomonas alba]